jgi:galactokinase
MEFETIFKRFREVYPEGGAPQIWRAPGRVNLIGEHTDYNLGYVLPLAIDLACYVATAPGRDGRLRVYSEQLKDSGQWRVEEISQARPRGDWTDRVIGIAWELRRRGIEIASQDVLITSTVPLGSGLSSSAALGVSLAGAFGGARPARELAEIAYTTEREFVGVPCGIMDQFAAACGQEGAAILIDCRSLEWRAVTLPEEIAIVAADTTVKHEHASGAYRTRVQECAAASRAIGVESLRDARLSDLDKLYGNLLKRARHVVTENLRVAQFVEAAARGDVEKMGCLATESHRSLRDDYEVSCEELDFLVEAALRVPGVVGARMTGGGFGGSTVNFVHRDEVDALGSALVEGYRSRWGRTPAIHRCVAAGGAGQIFS